MDLQCEAPQYIETHTMRWSSTISYEFYIVRCKAVFCEEFSMNARWPETAIRLAKQHRERCGQMVRRRAGMQGDR